MCLYTLLQQRLFLFRYVVYLLHADNPNPVAPAVITGGGWVTNPAEVWLP
jgi:hypothetical protein